jgi:hypothetical protein
MIVAYLTASDFWRSLCLRTVAHLHPRQLPQACREGPLTQAWRAQEGLFHPSLLEMEILSASADGGPFLSSSQALSPGTLSAYSACIP